MVRCEKGGLRRVLMNLVGNSFKFTKVGIRFTRVKQEHLQYFSEWLHSGFLT